MAGSRAAGGMAGQALSPKRYPAWHLQAQYVEFANKEVEAASGGELGGGGMAGQNLNPIISPAGTCRRSMWKLRRRRWRRPVAWSRTGTAWPGRP